MLFIILGLLIILIIAYGIVAIINENKRRRAARIHMERLDEEARQFYQSNNH